MKRVILVVVATLGLSCASALPSLAQSGPDESARQMSALKRDLDKLKAETAALKKQIEDLKKGQGDLNGHVDMLLKHRHQLFVDSMRADSFFPVRSSPAGPGVIVRRAAPLWCARYRIRASALEPTDLVPENTSA